MPRRLVILVFIVAALVACSGLVQQPLSVNDEYQQNLQRWQNLAWQNYDVSYQRQCFCLPEQLKAIRVEVRAGSIANAVYADDNSPLAAGIEYDLITVNGLFGLIVEAIERPADQLHVSYDKALGFPDSISIDYVKRMADDEVVIKNIYVIRK